MTFPETRTIEALRDLPHLSGSTLDAAHQYLAGPGEWKADLALGPVAAMNGQPTDDPSEFYRQYREAKALCETLTDAVQAHWVQLIEAKAV
ncbi:hypothetical protein [Verrucomicrobium sp. BvORR106]|uniref:hypothetical protein n=1 Tax=Verrucomicrobium sp. BvORR106 TaxID=1403819 RepID=UPI00056DA94C|nr:hypothetical protein [Verrucomicrobium sp. BvORR106]